MYRIDNKPEAIKRVQQYLEAVSDPTVYVAPSGVYDENTRLSVIYFQNSKNLTPSGVIDYSTFVSLYEDYLFVSKKRDLAEKTAGFITFPLMPGYMAEEMLHINRLMRDLLDHYGLTHSLRDSNFYSHESQKAVRSLRQIYGLKNAEFIDEELYGRMVNDRNSIEKLRK